MLEGKLFSLHPWKFPKPDLEQPGTMGIILMQGWVSSEVSPSPNQLGTGMNPPGPSDSSQPVSPHFWVFAAMFK